MSTPLYYFKNMRFVYVWRLCAVCGYMDTQYMWSQLLIERILTACEGESRNLDEVYCECNHEKPQSSSGG
jgi:hypothetical protein